MRSEVIARMGCIFTELLDASSSSLKKGGPYSKGSGTGRRKAAKYKPLRHLTHMKRPM